MSRVATVRSDKKHLNVVTILTFSCLCILIFNQTNSGYFRVRDTLDTVRWVALSMYVALAFFGSIVVKRSVRHIYLFDVLMISFIVLAFASSLYSVEPSLTIERSASLLLLYIAVFRVLWGYSLSYERVVDLANTILAAATVLYGACVIAVFVSYNLSFNNDRYSGIMENPNALGLLTAILLPLVLWKAFETRNYLHVTLCCFMSLALVLSGSRAGLISAALGSSYFISRVFRKRRAAVLMTGLVIAAIAFLFLSDDSYQGSFSALYRPESARTGSGRVEAWSSAIELIKEKPVTGYGFGTEDKLFETYGYFFQEHQGGYVHNSYLGLAAQIGILGAIVFFGPLFYLLFSQVFSKSRKELLHYALIGALLSGLIEAYFESWPYSVGNSMTFPFWIMVMLLVRFSKGLPRANS